MDTTRTDQVITCRDCGTRFTFTSGEQDFYASRGLTPPIRCAECRARRKQERAAPAYPARERAGQPAYRERERRPQRARGRSARRGAG